MTDTGTITRDSRRDRTDDKPTEPKRLFDLSATQLVGGALAAMTSAVIGARLGVAGTILGAAIGSIVAGIAGSLYTASLKHTRDKLTSALVGRVGDTQVSMAPVSERTVEIARVPDDTVRDRAWSWEAPESPASAAAMAPASAEPVAVAAEVEVTGARRPRLPWKPILVSTAAVFLLAIAGLTGFELVSGQAISGGQGTTITQVGEGRSGSSDEGPSTVPSSSPSAVTSTEPSAGPSATPEPSSSATAEPSETTSQSPQPSESSEPSTSGEPTPSATPSTASGEGSADTDGEVVTGG
jgi:hypothetical protein